MKELTTEEKAKAYDEAIKIAKEINNEHKAQPFDVMTRVFPELAESDDENIRKALIHYFDISYNIAFVGDKDIKNKDIIAWLEKQSDEAKIEALRTEYEKGRYDALHEQKHVECSEKDEKILKIVKQMAYDIVKTSDEQFIERHGTSQQELTDWSFGHITQPKQEWSEEDKKMFVNIKSCLRNSDKDYSKEVDWLMNLFHQSKQKWSNEDDEHRKTDAIYFLETAKKHYASTSEIEKTINWLKSLRPQNKWKPSDEQMKTLNKVIFCTYNANNIEDRKHIESLYNDLNKLSK